MTGLLLFVGVIVLLAVALEVTHRRVAGSWRPGLDTRGDRDLARRLDDLQAAGQREQLPTAPVNLGYLTPRQQAAEAWRFSRLAA